MDLNFNDTRQSRRSEQSETRKLKYGEKVLQTAIQFIESSPEGFKHKERLERARLIGGYIASGFIDEQRAIDTLMTAIKVSSKNPGKAFDDILDGVNHGKLSPIIPKNWKDEPGESYKPTKAVRCQTIDRGKDVWIVLPNQTDDDQLQKFYPDKLNSVIAISGSRPDTETEKRLLKAEAVLISTGENDAWAYWLNLPTAIRLPFINGYQSIKDMIKGGISPKSWILSGLKLLEKPEAVKAELAVGCDIQEPDKFEPVKVEIWNPDKGSFFQETDSQGKVWDVWRLRGYHPAEFKPITRQWLKEY